MPSMKAVMQQNSTPPSLSSWNDIVSIIGVPLGAMLSLIAIMLAIKHHREARRCREASRRSQELNEISVPHTRDINIQTKHIHISKEVGRPEFQAGSNVASYCSTTLPVRASTYPGIYTNTRSWTPARAATYNGKRNLCYLSPNPDLEQSLSRDSNRASQITLRDEEEYSNPTMIITYPSAVYVNPKGHTSRKHEVEMNQREEDCGE